MTLTAAKRIWAKEDRQIVADVHQICAGSGLSQDDLARRLGMSRRTLYARLQNPKRFTIEEMRNIELLRSKRK